MDDTNTLRTASELAREALELFVRYHSSPFSFDRDAAMAKADAALKALAQPEPAIEAEASSYPKPYAGDWSVFNGAGACICERVNFQIAADYMTENRFACGWTMVACKAIKSAQDLASASASEAQSHAAWPTDATDRVHALMGEVATQAQEIERLRYQLVQPEPAPTPPVALPAVVDAEAVAQWQRRPNDVPNLPWEDTTEWFATSLECEDQREFWDIRALYTHPAPASARDPDERTRLRAAQDAAVMPLIGPLLDAYEGARGSLREDYPELAKQLSAINRAMETAGDDDCASSPASGASTEVQAPIQQASGEAQGEAVGGLYQHSETGRTRVVMNDAVADCDASWLFVGDLVLKRPAPPASASTASREHGIASPSGASGEGEAQR